MNGLLLVCLLVANFAVPGDIAATSLKFTRDGLHGFAWTFGLPIVVISVPVT
jgi:hypothetical protein